MAFANKSSRAGKAGKPSKLGGPMGGDAYVANIEDKQKSQALSRTIQMIEKTFGKGSIMRQAGIEDVKSL